MSNRKRGARTNGVKKARDIEAKLLAEQWRENAGALCGDRGEANAALDARLMQAVSGRKIASPKRVNHLVLMLRMAAGALDDDVLAHAAERLERLGLGGDDYEARIQALVPSLPDVAMQALMERERAPSERAAADRLAAKYAVPALSHSSAAKTVTRRASKARR